MMGSFEETKKGSIQMCKFLESRIGTDRGYTIPTISWVGKEDQEILICVRGFGGGRYSTIVERIAQSLKPMGIGVFSFTWPAHGISDASGDMLTVENCLADMEDVVRFLKEEYPGKALSCFATSFGGFMAVVYHQKYPEEFEKIILRSPAVQMAGIIYHFMTPELREAYFAGEKLNFSFDENPLILGREYYDSLLRYPVFEMQVARPGKFTIIQGDADEIVPPEDVRAFAERNGIPILWAQGADHQYTNPGGQETVLDYTRQLMKSGRHN